MYHYKEVKTYTPKEYKTITAQLKAYKNGQADILLQQTIKEPYKDLAEFQNKRIAIIETFKNDFDKFETNLIKEV